MKTENHDDVCAKFVKHVKNHIEQHGFKLIITKGEALNIGYGVGRASGIFYQNKQKTIRVAGERPQLEIVCVILHEYCHFLQFINKEEVWVKASRTDWEQVLHDKSVDKKKMAYILECDKLRELDAEKKSVALIKKWNLPIDIEDYIKEANAYIYFFVYMMKYRKWCNKVPGAIPSILDIMPSKFCRKYDTLPQEYEKLVNRYCI